MGFWCGKAREHQEDSDVGGRIILKWILEEYDGMIWIGSMFFRIGNGRGLL
jgi:hypothetical protein